MDLLRLTRPVAVSGRDMLGRKAQIRFLPLDMYGWHWKCGNQVVPITSDIASSNSRRITLQYKGHLLEIYEHIGVLRWTGLDGVAIESARMPPYFGRARELWQALEPFCKKTGEKIPWIQLCGDYSGTACVNGRNVTLSPGGNGLTIKIFIDFKDLGEKTSTYGLPMPLGEIFEARTLGWPSCLYYPSKLVGLLGWPHNGKAEWAQENSRQELLEKIALHRAGDLLGALSLITHDRLVSGKVISLKGGHKLDIGMIKKIRL
jgi:hypothetical protein